MPGHPDPERLASVASAAGDLGRCADATSEELLDSLVMVGDHATQRAVDDAVDALVARLRTVSSDAGETAWVLGTQAGGARQAGSHRASADAEALAPFAPSEADR